MPSLAIRVLKYVAVVAFVAAIARVAIIFAPPIDQWSVPHSAGPRLSAQRPECPAVWDTIPLFGVSALDTVDYRDTIKSPKSPSLVTPGNGGVAVRPTLAGPITNIPEFHDCQKFLMQGSNGVMHYDSLFAIFAAPSLDSIVSQVLGDNVTWESSDPLVASVSDGGLVTAMRAGAARIMAIPRNDPSRRASTLVAVGRASRSNSVAVTNISPNSETRVSLGPGQTLQLSVTTAGQTTSTLPVAEIYTYGNGDSTLGIGPNFSCLYVYLDASGQMRAKMVAVDYIGTDLNACTKAADPNDPHRGTELTLVRNPGGLSSDYPATARWEWDSVNTRQSIGIKCGNAWCEIGPKDKFSPPDGHPVADGMPPGERRVIGIKGWYDEQYLASDNSNGTATPTRILGTVIPDPALNSIDDLKFQTHHWFPVAYIALDVRSADPRDIAYYKTKFNVDPVEVGASLERLNRLLTCYGTREECSVPAGQPAKSCGAESRWLRPVRFWWSMTISATTHETRYHCMIRREETPMLAGVRIPATARWRWIAHDETTWNACTQGCCEVDAIM